MTALKLASKLGATAHEACEPYVAAWYANDNASALAIVELAHSERLQVAPGEDRESTVTMRIRALEVASPEQAHTLREVQRALYLQRTARGTLDDDGTLQLDRESLRLAGGELLAIRVAHLTAGAKAWGNRLRVLRDRVAGDRVTTGEISRELREIVDGLQAVLDLARDDED